MLQIERCLQEAEKLLGIAKSNLSMVINTNSMLPVADNQVTTYSSVLQTLIATCISDLNTALAGVYYSPDQIHP